VLLNDEYVYQWEMCHFEGVGATRERHDRWLVALFANEYEMLVKDGIVSNVKD